MDFGTADRRARPSAHVRPVAGWLLVLSLFALASARPASADEGLDAYNLAIGLYKQQRWEQSADQLRAFIKNYPKHAKLPLARLYLGLTLIQQKEYVEARTVLRGFVKDYPESKYRADALYRVGECSYLARDFKTAEQEFAKFVAAYPKNELAEWALPYLADAQRRSGKFDAAVKTYRQALQQFPESRFTEDSTYGLARCYESLEQTADALDLYRKIASNRTSDRAPDAQMALAAVYFDSEQFERAAENYELFVEQFPHSPLRGQAELNAGYAHYQAGDFRHAITRFEQAAGHKGQEVTAAYWKGVSQKSLGGFADAAETLQAVFRADETGPLAENALFQWADAEFRGRRFEQARSLFLDVAARWPSGELADDSLHLATEAALEQGELDEADRLVARFKREYPRSALRMYNEILEGRLWARRGGTENWKTAAGHFRHVAENSTVTRTRSLARFHLARVLQQLEDDGEVLKAVAPLVEQIAAEGESSEFVDALIIAAGSQLALDKHDEAVESASLYLKLRPSGSQAEQALAVRAISRAHLGKQSESQADLSQLAAAAPNSPVVAETTYKVAEIAYDAKQWRWSADMYERLVEAGPKTPKHASALSGLAWCRFQQKKYLEAAQYFGRLVEQHPEEKMLASEAAFKRAESLENAERLPEAAGAYQAAFETFAPDKDKPPKTGDEQKPPMEYAYLAGLNRARVLRALKEIEEADAAYERLLTRFPKPSDFDERLDEWALLNYDAGNYKRSDEIFRRLVKEAPDSDLADNAWLSLAESDLLAGRVDDAQKTFRRLEGDAKSDKQVQEVSLYHLIGIAVDGERWKEVAGLSGEFLRRFPQSSRADYAQFQTGNALMNRGEYEQAQKIWLKLSAEKAEAVDGEEPWVPQIWIMLAETHFRMKHYDEVEAAVDQLRARDPKCPLLYQADEVLGRSYKNRAKFEEARAALRRVIADPHGRRTETAAKSQFLLAETYLIQKDYKNAQTEHFKVYHLYKFPAWQSASLYQAALCDEALGRWSDAAKLYEELLQKFPESEFAANAKPRLELARKKAGR